MSKRPTLVESLNYTDQCLPVIFGNPKKLNMEQKKRFCSVFGLSKPETRNIYKNFTNIILTDKRDFLDIKHYVGAESIQGIIELREYNISLYAIDITNNKIVQEALGDK